MEKNFLIKIIDQHNILTLNNNSEFEDFILEEKIDSEEKRSIISIFISLFIIVYITTFQKVILVKYKENTHLKNIVKPISKSNNSFKDKGIKNDLSKRDKKNK